MPGFATSAHTKANAIRLMEALGVTGEELDIRPAARTDAGRPRPPVRARRAGLRHDLRECAGRAAHRLSVPPGQPPQRHRARHRRPVGAGAGLVHLWRRRPDVALQRQCRGAEDADPASDPLGDRLARSSTPTCGDTLDAILATEISPELVPAERGRDSAEHRGQDRPLCAAGLQPVLHRCATASGRRRSPSWRCMPGAMRRAATGRRASRPSGAAPTTWPTIRHWLEVFLRRFFAFSQFKRVGHAERAEGDAPAARCRRAATGGRRRTAMPMPGSRNWNATCRRARRHGRSRDRDERLCAGQTRSHDVGAKVGALSWEGQVGAVGRQVKQAGASKPTLRGCGSARAGQLADPHWRTPCFPEKCGAR